MLQTLINIWQRTSRAYYRAEWWVGRCFAFALKGIVGRTQNWGLAGGGIVGFASDAWGLKMTPLEGWQGALVSGAAGIGAAWVILVVARLLIAPFRMWQGGKWYGRNWSHKSLEGPAPEYSVGHGRVLKGQMVIGFYHQTARGDWYVRRAAGGKVGRVSSPAEAMLMLIRDHEGGQR